MYAVHCYSLGKGGSTEEFEMDVISQPNTLTAVSWLLHGQVPIGEGTGDGARVCVGEGV